MMPATAGNRFLSPDKLPKTPVPSFLSLDE